MNSNPSCNLQPGPLRVLDIKAMHGANYFSGGPVVIIKLDLGDYDEVFTHQIEGFYKRLKTLLPSLQEHHCSPGVEGGFFMRVAEGTLLGHVTEHVAIELQTLAGMDVGFGKTRATTAPGVYHVVFRFMDETAGRCAAASAVNLVNAILTETPFEVPPHVRKLIQIREERLLGPSTQAIIDEAERRQIPTLRLDNYNLVQLGTGIHQKRIRATLSSDTSFIAVETVDDKYLTATMLADAGLPVPVTQKVASSQDALAFQNSIQGPVTLKPRTGFQGNGVSVRLSKPEQMAAALAWARTFDQRILAQETVPGNTYRLLVIDYRFVAAVKLTPPAIVGDGHHTIRDLIDQLNQDPLRSPGEHAKLSAVAIDALTQHIIAAAGYHPESVLPAKEVLVLKHSGSLRLGGAAVDVTDEIHGANCRLAERASQVVGLNVAGVDVIAPTLRSSILENGGKILEINSAPDFRMHLHPTAGRSRKVAESFMEMLFPQGRPTRVPIVSVTGSYGKAEAAGLIAHGLKASGHVTALAGSNGLQLSGQYLQTGDMTAPEQVQRILREPTIDSAVLETSVEGILGRGLGYHYAEVGIVLNLHPRKIDSDYAQDLADVAYAKSVVAEQIYDSGFAVLNAESELIMKMADRAGGRLVLFSRHDQHPRIQAHLRHGGLAAVVDRERLLICDGQQRIPVTEPTTVALLLAALPGQYALDVILAATAALYAIGLVPANIRQALASYR